MRDQDSLPGEMSAWQGADVVVGLTVLALPLAVAMLAAVALFLRGVL